MCIIIAACLVPSVDAVNPGDEGHMSCVRDFMDFATVVQELAMNMPELPATFSTVPRVDYNQESDTDEFEKQLSKMHRKFRRKPLHLKEMLLTVQECLMETPVTMTLNVAQAHPKSTKILKVALQQTQTHFMNFHQILNLLLGTLSFAL